ncbi:hypothetical protein ACLOJK_019860 [Asimina triloba]
MGWKTPVWFLGNGAKNLIGGAVDDLVQEMNRGAAGAVHSLDSEDAARDVRYWCSRIQHVLTKLSTGSDRSIIMSPKIGQTVAMVAALDGDGSSNLVLSRSIEFGAPTVCIFVILD